MTKIKGISFLETIFAMTMVGLIVVPVTISNGNFLRDIDYKVNAYSEYTNASNANLEYRSGNKINNEEYTYNDDFKGVNNLPNINANYIEINQSGVYELSGSDKYFVKNNSADNLIINTDSEAIVYIYNKMEKTNIIGQGKVTLVEVNDFDVFINNFTYDNENKEFSFTNIEVAYE